MKKNNLFNWLCIVFLFLFGLQSFGADQERRSELLKLINEELTEVVRLVKRGQGKNPTLILRIAELNFEKARLIKEDENYKYIMLSPDKRKKVKKDKYFSSSRKHFQKAQKAASYLLKRYKNFKGKADVLYIMAFNAKEFGQDKKAENYLKRSVKLSKGKGSRGVKSLLALADTFYNKMEYSKAIPLYKKALATDKKRNWWTKDAFNLGWCYLRIKDYDKAIKMMRKIHVLSKDRKYVDMSSQVERDLAYFYAMANKTDQAIKFYRSIGADIPKVYLKVSGYLLKQGKITSAEKVLRVALTQNPTKKQSVMIYMSLLEMYEKFGNYREHYKISQKVYKLSKKGVLNDQQSEQYKYQLQTMASRLQKLVVGKTYKKRPKIRKKKASLAVSYFDLLRQFDEDQAHQWYFHAGETLFAVSDYNKCLSYYDQAHKLALKKNDKKKAKLALDGLIASLAQAKIKKKNREKYLLYSYQAYIKFHPNNKKSHKIHQRLFKIHFDKGDMEQAEVTIKLFKKNFPKDDKIPEAMIAQIMDYYKDRKDGANIAKWVGKIKAGEYKISSVYLKRLKQLLLALKFEKVENATKAGDKKQALLGYIEIFNSKASDRNAKKNAAYNISIILYEIDEVERSYFWAQKAMGLMNLKDLRKFENSFITIADELFNRRQFDLSSTLYFSLMGRFCKARSDNKNSLFKNAYILSLAEDKLKRAQTAIDLSAKCKISGRYRDRARIDLLNYLSKKGKWSHFLDKLKEYQNIGHLRPKLMEPLSKLMDAYTSMGRVNQAIKIRKKIIDYYNYSRKKKYSISLEALDLVVKFRKLELERISTRLNLIKLSFPEKKYNKALKNKFAELDRLTTAAMNMLKIGSGNGIVFAYKMLSKNYQALADEVKNFSPPGKSKSYVKSFKKSMRAMAGQVAAKSREFFREGRKQIAKNKILSTDNSFFLSKGLPFDVNYKAFLGGVIMDKGGRR